MFFAAFANPAFLFGLLAMALPVIIHLLAKRRAAEMIFPPLRFLQQTAERTASRRRIEEWLLLLLRAAALGIAALALAQPTISGLGAGRHMAMALLLDNSLSMQQEAGGRTAWEAAKETALRVLEAGEPKGEAAVASQAWGIWLPCLQAEDDALRHIQRRAQPEARQLLAACQVTSGKGDTKHLLRDAASALNKYPADGREIYIFTDGQATEWEGLTEALAEDTPAPAQRIFVYVPPGCGGPNLNLQRLAIKMRAALPGEEAQFQADIRNWSDRLAETAVSCYLNGALLSRQAVSVPSRGKASAIFHTTWSKAGWQSGLIQIDSDGLCQDNRRHFAIEVPEAAQICIADGSESLLARARTAYYLEAALGAAPAMKTRRIPAAALPAEDLEAYDVIFLVDTTAPSPEGAAKLRLFAKGGGTAVFVPGSLADIKAWNSLLGPGSDEMDGMLPAALAATFACEGEEGAALEAEGADHPLLASFGSVAAQVRKAKVKQAYAVAGDPDQRGARVALSAGSAPIALSRPYGKGRAILWTTSLAPEWTNLATKPIFVPFVLNHVYWARQRPEAGGSVAGQSLLIARPATPCEMKGIIHMPNGQSQPLAGVAGPEQPLFFPHTAEDGIYSVEMEKPAKATSLRAVNATNADSDLTRIDNQTLISSLERLGPAVVVDSWQALAEEMRKAREGMALMVPLLWLVLAILMFEGHYAASLRRQR